MERLPSFRNTSPIDRPEYYKMIGAKFDHHPKIHKFKLHLHKDNGLLDASFANYSVIDELYYYSQFENDNKVLLYAKYLDKSSPMAWVRDYGKGRVFFTQRLDTVQQLVLILIFKSCYYLL